MSPDCLKCRKKYGKNKMMMIKQWYYQNVLYVVVKNQDLL